MFNRSPKYKKKNDLFIFMISSYNKRNENIIDQRQVMYIEDTQISSE